MKPLKAAEAKAEIAAARKDLASVLETVRRWAADEDWRTREVAASVLVEASKKHPDAVLRNARAWAKDGDANVRRAACEGLRSLARTDFRAIIPILDLLRDDDALYVRKSVANMMRDGTKAAPKEVAALARRWSKAPTENTLWILRHGTNRA
jgi:3-methyladenine DNA glycosylase AlkC